MCEERRCHHREVSARVGSGHGQSRAILSGTRAAAAPLCSPTSPGVALVPWVSFLFSQLFSTLCSASGTVAVEQQIHAWGQSHEDIFRWDGMKDYGQ